MTDHVYNLMSQLTEESKSLWRMKKYYENETTNCMDCQTMWGNMIVEKEKNITELTALLKNHLEVL